jgi:3-methyladenine DNA glycosylase AlkC
MASLSPWHPAQRFKAPAAIESGVPLKSLMDRRLIALIGESLAAVVPRFDLRQFRAEATGGLESLELMQRAEHIAAAMARQLPDDFDQCGPLLVKSFGPELGATGGNGLAPFFYLPHSCLVARAGVSRFESGMTANHELTRRFSAEFSIRPFLIAHRERCLRRLRRWSRDPNPHVRRLVSEGTRPRLPWAMRLPEFQAQPELVLPLLDRLKDDAELYVRRSVANHLGDIAKDHPDVAFEVCERWLAEVGPISGPRSVNRRWLIRHAVRYSAKKGDARAQKIRDLAS